MNKCGRIINVSNRLPVKISDESKELCYQLSEGGLATGLSAVFKTYENLWLGWPGAFVEEEGREKVAIDLQAKKLHPIFLTREEISRYYEGFCNETIWPLFHYFLNYSGYDPECFETYKAVNEKFANEIARVATKDDIIWIHDYQLMLVPQMLRGLMPESTIGFFLHIPFPSYPVFTTLPWRKEVLAGLMGANLIGFQTNDDVQHFTDVANRILDINFIGNEVLTETGKVVAQAFPISIDYNKFHELAIDPVIQCSEASVSALVGENKLVISVDRLDYSKGIIQRLKAYELFLQQHPEWHEKITWIHVIVPSRDTVRNYKELKEEMDRSISAINGKYASLTWQPIKHFYRSVSPELLSALYKKADVALVTPLRDGMNLVCKEYVASNVQRHGVLVLSETAGAARELTDALLVNPNDIQALSDQIYQALNMPASEKAGKMERMQQTIKNADVFKWAKAFVDALLEMRETEQPALPSRLAKATLQKVEVKYCYSSQRLIFLDYDGTLMPFFDVPGDAKPDQELLSILNNLTGDPSNKIVVISGRDHQTLETWLGHLPLGLIAEHGLWQKEDGQRWKLAMDLNNTWKKNFQNVFEAFTKATPGSFIEHKTSSMAWHYRQCDEEIGITRARELCAAIENGLNEAGLQLLRGDKVLELKHAGIDKGLAAKKWLHKGKYDFLMAIGDDVTDEDMFRTLPTGAITIKVGSNITAARYFVYSYKDVRALLMALNESSRHFNKGIALQLTG